MCIVCLCMASLCGTRRRRRRISACVFLVLALLVRGGFGFGTFGFDVHHRYSDPVKGMLSVDDLPEKGSLQYYVAMAHRDRIILHGRGLAAVPDDSATTPPPLTFYYGNETYRLNALGYLHYANVSVGTPSLSFLVALDTGSDLFWLPCDCSSCVHGLQTSSGEKIEFNIYSPNTSSTSEKVACNSSLCKNQCPSGQTTCPYEVVYLSNGTSSTGYLVEDKLHLTTDVTPLKPVDAKVTFGCGQDQRGSFLDGAAPNGLFGLGMANVSVPSTLARLGLASNSFSMCFSPDGIGRITFGDKGSSDQAETPFNIGQSHRTYNVSITEITVGEIAADLEFSAIFDSGTSFTYIKDPAYTQLSESFNTGVKEPRFNASNSGIPFEYCYALSSNQTTIELPDVTLTMKGGAQFNLTDPIVIFLRQGKADIYCLALVKSNDVNIIGQNFMTGYRIVFDREREILGWTPSTCYDALDSNTLPINPTPTVVPPATAVNPEATAGSGDSTPPGLTSGSHSSRLSPLAYSLVIVAISVLLIA